MQGPFMRDMRHKKYWPQAHYNDCVEFLRPAPSCCSVGTFQACTADGWSRAETRRAAPPCCSFKTRTVENTAWRKSLLSNEYRRSPQFVRWFLGECQKSFVVEDGQQAAQSLVLLQGACIWRVLQTTDNFIEVFLTNWFKEKHLRGTDG